MKSISAAIAALALVAACGQPAPSPWVKPPAATVSCADYHSEAAGADIYNNNVWNKNAAGAFPWKQCIERDPGRGLLGWSWSWPHDSKSIFAYPQVKRGTSPWAPLPHAASGLPISHESVTALRVTHELEIVTNGRHNVATSMWLTSTDAIGERPNPSVILAELMVWTYATPGHMTPAGTRVTDVELDGQQWEVWVDRNWGDASGANQQRWIYLTYRAKRPSLQASFDVVKLTRHAVEQNLLPPRFHYADVEVGTEVMSGSGLAWVKGFDVRIERAAPAAGVR